MPPLYLLQLDNVPIFEQLQYEEALLRADQRNYCLINSGSPPAIVMGISGEANRLVDKKKFHENPLPLIRRFSGGGTVVIDPQTIFITFIFNSTSLNISPFPQSIMRWTESIYQPLFDGLPFNLRENDYVLAEKKIGGNAQSITKNRWLHHSSFLFDFNPQLMDLLLLPQKMPDYRNRRTHNDFLSCLSHYWPSIQHFKSHFIGQLKQKFTLQTILSDELKGISLRPHRKTSKLEIYL